MSLEAVRQFYDTIVSDDQLRRRIIDANEKFAGTTLADDDLERLMAEEFLPLLKEEGFYFSIDELVEYQKQNQKLSSTEFKKVSGGIQITRKQAILNLLNTIFNT